MSETRVDTTAVKQKPETVDTLIDELPSRYVVGIDLGTTNSAVTWIDTEQSPWSIRVLSIPQRVAFGETESLDTLPSFHYQPPKSVERSGVEMEWRGNGSSKSDTNACVGAWARDEMARTSGRAIASAKSWLCHAAVDRTSALLPWQAATDVKRLSPVDVSSSYLSHIAHAWDQQFPGNRLAEQDIVLTLPASFDEVARELTIEAAAKAGLKRVVLIEEPQAAFYAWVYKHDSEDESGWQSKVSVGQKILVCDIGGGTTDLTLIRVKRAAEQDTAQEGAKGSATERVRFHRVAVGQHLILGGDNLDLAIAKHIEAKLTDGGQLESHQWDVLIGSSRRVKEQMLSDDAPKSLTVNLPGRGSKLIGGSQQAEVSRAEIRELIFNGFLPKVEIGDRPTYHASGFQEFGLPYASDPAITRYLADFLMSHATAGIDELDVNEDEEARQVLAAPDIILFNGGFFASAPLQSRLVEQIASWFGDFKGAQWRPEVLENDRLDLAVARGAAYYGMVRRDEGVRIAASLARSYYIEIGNGQAVCIMPGSAEAGQTFELKDQTFMLTISQPVEFSIFVSSVRLADSPGQVVTIDRQQLTALPPIRTVLKAKSKNEKRDVAVSLKVGLTEIGTIDLSAHQVDETDGERSWKLQFDVRSTTQTDVQAHQSSGEGEGVLDESTWVQCRELIDRVFTKCHPEPMKPRELIKELALILEMDRHQWPMSLLRRIWETLMDCRQGRRQSAAHEARWLNLLGYALRPGYGMALDDWRVTETWRHVRGNLVHPAANIQNESLILWRRLSGGLSAGQQSALAEPLLAAIRSLKKQMAGKAVKSSAVPLKPEGSTEVWRLLGALELLSVTQKIELGDLILELKDKKRLAKSRSAMIWALGRLGQRKPMYGPINVVIPPDDVAAWVNELLKTSGDVFQVVQMCHRTGSRYSDISDGLRANVLAWLIAEEADDQLVTLVRDGGEFGSEQQSQVFGESLPAGLRLA
jgi:molecular chaperone DnaK (HSP70)